ncbi:hypothetical protein CEXT_315271 [Caerostris extrusa]|uniref:Uncharacterized protein n=1 Tax=Caerostris extrusa TaxID=172846 RepID=A0AAV4Y8I6_CAEEX|nr:hypothetical protein CEXT_315271 [Caerostris extrusa]
MYGICFKVMVSNHLVQTLLNIGSSFLSETYRRHLRKIVFSIKEKITMKVADRNYVQPLGKCVFQFEINSRIQPFEFTVLPNCIYDIILVWVFLEVSQAIIHRDKSELVFEDCVIHQILNFGLCMLQTIAGYYPIYCQNICHQSQKGSKYRHDRVEK